MAWTTLIALAIQTERFIALSICIVAGLGNCSARASGGVVFLPELCRATGWGDSMVMASKCLVPLCSGKVRSCVRFVIAPRLIVRITKSWFVMCLLS